MLKKSPVPPAGSKRSSRLPLLKVKPLAITAEADSRVISILDLATRSFKQGRAIRASF